jgi:hypothetical protein
MTLLRDIQDAAINSEIDISTVLWQCKVLAYRGGPIIRYFTKSDARFSI